MSSRKLENRTYDLITDEMRQKLIVRHLLYGMTIRQSADDVGIKYFTAKHIVKVHRKKYREKGATEVRPIPLDMT